MHRLDHARNNRSDSISSTKRILFTDSSSIPPESTLDSIPQTRQYETPFVGVVLCGGKSKRMGFDKARLPFGNETMLQRIVRILSEDAKGLVVVSRSDLEIPNLPKNVHVALDERQDYGPLEGIRVGLSRAHQEFGELPAFVTSCDVPLLQMSFVQFLLSRIESHSIVVPVDGRFKHPLSAIYRTTLFREIELLQQLEIHRPVALFERTSTLEVHVDQLKTVDPDLDSLKNLNQPSDYLSVLKQLGLEYPTEILEVLRDQPADKDCD